MKKNEINGHYSRIENSTKVKGEILSKGDFRIDGLLEGSIKTNGKVVVGLDGSIKGAVTCSNADIEGKINGNLFVSETLSLRSTSIIEGDVVIGKLIVESGATLNANCSMNEEGKKSDFKVVKNANETHEKTA
tara:strand:+ start:261 stop:659 length:399 start_codon:yes stop_codon:yes gene_type:complete